MKIKSVLSKIHQFQETYHKLSPEIINDLSAQYKGFGSEFPVADADSSEQMHYIRNYDEYDELFYMVGQGVKVFTMLLVGISVAIVSFVIAMYIGYYAWDYNMRRIDHMVKEHAMNRERVAFKDEPSVVEYIPSFNMVSILAHSLVDEIYSGFR